MDRMKQHFSLEALKAELQRAERGDEMIGIPFLTFSEGQYDDALLLVRRLGFSFVDCSRFEGPESRRLLTEEVDRGERFLLMLPRRIPDAIAGLIIQLTDQTFPNGLSKAWAAMMSRSNYEQMESAWSPTRIKQRLIPHIYVG